MKKYFDCHSVSTWMPTMVLNLFDSKVQQCPRQYWKLLWINCIYAVFSWSLRADWILYFKCCDLKLLEHSWKQSSPCMYGDCSDMILPCCWNFAFFFFFLPNKLLLVCKCLSPAHSIALPIVPIYRWTTSIGFTHLWAENRHEKK